MSVEITDSILGSIKHLLGPGMEHEFFDKDIILHINSAFMVLAQLGVGPTTPFTIQDDTALWSDFTTDEAKLRSVIDYVYLRVRLIFDPPTTSFVLSALQEQQKELEWRLNVMAETPTWDSDDTT